MLSLFLKTLCTNLFIMALSTFLAISPNLKLFCVCYQIYSCLGDGNLAEEYSPYQCPSIVLRTDNQRSQRLNIKRLCVASTFKMAEVSCFNVIAAFFHASN